MHGFSYSPAIPLGLFNYLLLAIHKAQEMVVCFGNDTEVLLETHYRMQKHPVHICGKRLPWQGKLLCHKDALGFTITLYNLLFISAQLFRQLIAVGIILGQGRLIANQVYMAARGAGNDDGIHGMMAMIDAFFAKSLLQLERHVWDKMTRSIGSGKLLRSCKLVHALKARQDDAVPHIVDAPIAFQTVGNASRAHNDIL